MIATAWEIFKDRHGDLNKVADIWVRIPLLILEAVALHFITGKHLLLSFNLSAATFFLFFDPIVTYVMIRNGTLEPPRGVKYHWFSYQAKSGVIDNLKFWKSLKPAIKLGIRIAYFAVSLVLFLIATP